MDKKVLCIDCILNEDHKNHEIMSLEKACQREKEILIAALEAATIKESQVQHIILKIENHLSELVDSANFNRS